MGPRFVIIDHDSPMLLPCDLRDWLPEDHMAHFILDAVETLDLSGDLQRRGGAFYLRGQRANGICRGR